MTLTKQQIDDMRTSLGLGANPFSKEAIDSLCALAVRGLAVPEVARIDQSASNDLLNKIAVRPQDTWTPQEVSQLFLFACGCHNLIAAKSSPATEAGPLGGFAPVGPAAVELDFMLTQFQNELQTAMDDATSVEDSCYHDGEALKLKRQIIDRFAPSPLARIQEEKS